MERAIAGSATDCLPSLSSVVQSRIGMRPHTILDGDPPLLTTSLTTGMRSVLAIMIVLSAFVPPTGVVASTTGAAPARADRAAAQGRPSSHAGPRQQRQRLGVDRPGQPAGQRAPAAAAERRVERGAAYRSRGRGHGAHGGSHEDNMALTGDGTGGWATGTGGGARLWRDDRRLLAGGYAPVRPGRGVERPDGERQRQRRLAGGLGPVSTIPGGPAARRQVGTRLPAGERRDALHRHQVPTGRAAGGSAPGGATLSGTWLCGWTAAAGWRTPKAFSRCRTTRDRSP